MLSLFNRHSLFTSLGDLVHPTWSFNDSFIILTLLNYSGELYGQAIVSLHFTWPLFLLDVCLHLFKLYGRTLPCSGSYVKFSAFKLVKRFVTDLWLLYWRRGQIYYKLLALSQCNREKSSFDPTRSQKQTFLGPCAHLRYSRVPPWTSSMLVISNQYLKWFKSYSLPKRRSILLKCSFY